MKVTVFGAGYVGLVTAVCLAAIGHEVCCIEVDQRKLELLQQGQLPIYEEGLEDLLQSTIANAALGFTLDAKQGVQHGDILIIAVGTPPKADGSADLKFVEQVARTIGQTMTAHKVVVNKSTVPVGTAESVQKIISAELLHRGEQHPVSVASNPEFLREGCALQDFMQPDRIVIGVHDVHAREQLASLYAPLTEKGYPLLEMDTRSAELTKYASNAFLATKISFMNEISLLAERLGADIGQIKSGMSLDGRISNKFLNAGVGFGGSCFPKDVSALKKVADDLRIEPYVLNGVLQTNQRQQELMFHKIFEYFDGDLQGKRIALWGLAFKPNTDDIRCAPSLVLMEKLWAAGACVQAYDPMAMEHVRTLYPDEQRLQLCDAAIKACENADALLVVTEWDEFKAPDFSTLKATLTRPAIFDGRNIYNPQKLAELGFDYFSVGRNSAFAVNKAAQVL